VRARPYAPRRTFLPRKDFFAPLRLTHESAPGCELSPSGERGRQWILNEQLTKRTLAEDDPAARGGVAMLSHEVSAIRAPLFRRSKSTDETSHFRSC